MQFADLNMDQAFVLSSGIGDISALKRWLLPTDQKENLELGHTHPSGVGQSLEQIQLQAVGSPGRWNMACEKHGNSCQVAVRTGDGIRKV